MALFAVVVAVAAVESLMAAWSYRERVSPEDWSALEAELLSDAASPAPPFPFALSFRSLSF